MKGLEDGGAIGFRGRNALRTANSQISLPKTLSHQTGKSKHFGFIEFHDPEGYLLFEHLLQVHLILPEIVHLKLWKGFNPRFKPVDSVQEECKRQNKVKVAKTS
ncbi:hypothetical protein QYF36_007577 [Acer negundo]|nr:hypothetical protein QYF36_007577 [Acer negundo]